MHLLARLKRVTLAREVCGKTAVLLAVVKGEDSAAIAATRVVRVETKADVNVLDQNLTRRSSPSDALPA